MTAITHTIKSSLTVLVLLVNGEASRVIEECKNYERSEITKLMLFPISLHNSPLSYFTSQLIKLYEFSQNSGSAKCVLKREILKIQKGGDPIEWQHGTWNTLQYLRY